MAPHIVSSSFSDYVLLCLLLSAPFIPLAVRIIGDYLHDRPERAEASKSKEVPDPI
jgi:hypothetical protein